MSSKHAPVMVKPGIGYLPGSVNIGLVLGKNGAIIIDSGLDAQTAKKIKKGLDELAQPLQAIVQTHAHADHFGGNAHLLSVFPEAQVYAPPLEEAIIRYPVLEPIYLGMGAAPIPELTNKFLMAEGSRVDALLPLEGDMEIDGILFHTISLPGHSWQQVGIIVENICFAADGYFGADTLAKHKLPFLIDAHDTLLSLVKLLESNYEGYLPGHGPYEQSIERTITQNIHCHRRILDKIEALLAREELSLEQGLAALCTQLEIQIDNMTSYVLYRTAYMGYLIGLYREERITYRFHDNQLLWKKR